jgi:hypothetical protein
VNVFEGDQLNLTRISRTEMGAYLCIATNGVPPSVSKRIIVDVECKYYLILLVRNSIALPLVSYLILHIQYIVQYLKLSK